MEIVGHIIGFVATALFFLSYQVREKKKLLIIQTVATALLCLQYILIGAYSGFGLNIVCIIRNLLFYFRDKKPFSAAWMPLLPTAAMIMVSGFLWDGYHSLLIIFGLAVNTLCMGYFSAQNLRKSVLLTSTCILAYNFFAGSYSGMLNESVSVVSAALGIVRYKKEK